MTSRREEKGRRQLTLLNYLWATPAFNPFFRLLQLESAAEDRIGTAATRRQALQLVRAEIARLAEAVVHPGQIHGSRVAVEIHIVPKFDGTRDGRRPVKRHREGLQVVVGTRAIDEQGIGHDQKLIGARRQRVGLGKARENAEYSRDAIYYSQASLGKNTILHDKDIATVQDVIGADGIVRERAGIDREILDAHQFLSDVVS